MALVTPRIAAGYDEQFEVWVTYNDVDMLVRSARIRNGYTDTVTLIVRTYPAGVEVLRFAAAPGSDTTWNIPVGERPDISLYSVVVL